MIISFSRKGKTLFFVILLAGGWGWGTVLAFLLTRGGERGRASAGAGSGLTPPAARPRPSRHLGRERCREPAPLGIKFAPLGIKFSSRAWEKCRRRSLRAHREKNNSVPGPVWDFLPGRPGLQCVQKTAQFAPNIGLGFVFFFFPTPFFYLFFFHARPWRTVAPCARRRLPAARRGRAARRLAGGDPGVAGCPL